jgi:hypothetical protein
MLLGLCCCNTLHQRESHSDGSLETPLSEEHGKLLFTLSLNQVQPPLHSDWQCPP